MKILHYSLGFPPYRSGGLTKFCMDLMKQQVRDGHEVGLLWPGQIHRFGAPEKIKERDAVLGIKSFEIIDPLPVSYDEGILDTAVFMAEGNVSTWKAFLQETAPDVVHVHSLMGLHKAFFIAAKELNIRTVFTTHDLFPICPKVTLYRDNKICETAKDCAFCPECNETALSLGKIRLLQSPMYRRFKDSSLVKKLRKGHRDEFLSGQKETDKSAGPLRSKQEDYVKLREYYSEMLDLIDAIHYNSSVTKSVYERYLGAHAGKVLSITHGDISDHRTKKTFFKNGILKITYLAPQSGAKGYFELTSVLDQLYEKRQDFVLNLFFEPTVKRAYMRPHGRYDYSELVSIFDAADVLVAPSVWNETFGYTVLEALSYGVPVIISDRVGAKDIVPAGGGLIVKNRQELQDAIDGLTADKLASMNDMILQKASIKTIGTFSKEMMEDFYLN